MTNHLLIFGGVFLVACSVWTGLLVYFWPHVVNNLYKRAITRQGFGEGPIPINTLYVEPREIFADPLNVPASGSGLMTRGVNRDTLLVIGWLDLTDEPRLLHVPDFSDRYYSIQFTDPFNVPFAYVGTRSTGTKAGDYLISGPKWKGAVPGSVVQISSATDSVLVIGRILVYDDNDLATAHQLSTQVQLTSLSAWRSER